MAHGKVYPVIPQHIYCRSPPVQSPSVHISSTFAKINSHNHKKCCSKRLVFQKLPNQNSSAPNLKFLLGTETMGIASGGGGWTAGIPNYKLWSKIGNLLLEALINEGYGNIYHKITKSSDLYSHGFRFLEFLQELHGGNTAISSDCSIFTIQSNGASIQKLMEEIRLTS